MSKRSESQVNAQGWRATLKRWRRNNRQRLNRLLIRLMGTTAPRRQPLAPDTRRILVVRLNKRLGNILFLTPLLRTLAAALPAARIDVLIREPAHRSLLETLPGVGRIWLQPKGARGHFGLIRAIRRERYDLVIDPSGNSTSNRLAVALAGARQRMGFANRDQWLPLTHAGQRTHSRHQAEQAVELLHQTVDNLRFDTIDTLAVFPGERAQAAALQHWQRALGRGPLRGPVIGFFVEATGRKCLSCDWWQDWQREMRRVLPHARLLQIVPPGQTQSPFADTPQIGIAALDELAALLGRLDAFVAADSGPMHLAAAAGVPVIGLFKATDPAAYAPLGQRCVSLAGDAALAADNAAAQVRRVLDQRRAAGVA